MSADISLLQLWIAATKRDAESKLHPNWTKKVRLLRLDGIRVGTDSRSLKLLKKWHFVSLHGSLTHRRHVTVLIFECATEGIMIRFIPLFVAACFVCPAAAAERLEPVRLHAGPNAIPNIAGDGAAGTVTLNWRDNGNAWGYDVFTVTVRGQIATLEGRDQITDQPHTGEDMIRSVRFARGVHNGRSTLFALIASRQIVDSVPEPATTTVKVYALMRNNDAAGTPYQFKSVRSLTASRSYCNADMALKTELGFPLARSYSGPLTVDGCPR